MQDVPQIEAFRIPLHVELTEVLGFYFYLVLNCALHVTVWVKCRKVPCVAAELPIGNGTETKQQPGTAGTWLLLSFSPFPVRRSLHQPCTFAL